jgi:hypothetical protein
VVVGVIPGLTLAAAVAPFPSVALLSYYRDVVVAHSGAVLGVLADIPRLTHAAAVASKSSITLLPSIVIPIITDEGVSQGPNPHCWGKVFKLPGVFLLLPAIDRAGSASRAHKENGLVSTVVMVVDAQEHLGVVRHKVGGIDVKVLPHTADSFRSKVARAIWE